MGLTDPMSRANTGINLPSVPPAMSNYLNTQVQHIIGTEHGQDEPGGGGGGGVASGRNFHLHTGHTDAGVYTMAKHQRPLEQKQEPLPARAGIFFKLMQVTQPSVDKQELAIGEEEFNYLCQLRRRIARQLNEFYPFASLESFLKLDEESRPQTERRRKRPSLHAAPQRRSKLSKSLPNIKGALQGGGGAATPKKSTLKNDDVTAHDQHDVTERSRSQSNIGYRRTHVAFSMPAD